MGPVIAPTATLLKELGKNIHDSDIPKALEHETPKSEADTACGAVKTLPQNRQEPMT